MVMEGELRKKDWISSNGQKNRLKRLKPIEKRIRIEDI